MKKLLLLLPLIIACSNSEKNATVGKNYSEMNLAFGSCNDQHSPNQLFLEMPENSLDAFIWLGDIVYADSENPDSIALAYELLIESGEYQELMNQDFPILGTWDDHDYGQNDAGKEWPIKEESKTELLNFLNVSQDDPIWSREGVYSSHSFGEHGEVKLILLDTRWFRDALVEDTLTENRYTQNSEGDVLGEKQWKWLENELQDEEAKLYIIGSSIQVLAADHGWEKWDNFPGARDRLMKNLVQANSDNVVVISGDRHFAEVSKTTWDGQQFYDVTSSGLNHPFIAEADDNRLRVGEVVSEINYGLLQISWEGATPVVKAQIVVEGNQIALEENIAFGKLEEPLVQ
jgi:alkaline phosphatase D